MQQALKTWHVTAGFALFLVTGPLASHPQDGDARLAPVSRDKLCVTKGAIEAASDSKMEVTVPEMRAVVAYPTRFVAEARFTYLGPTKQDKPLGSGEIRRQFGLKLRAASGCNLVYAMWRIEPKQALVISEKLNPGQTTSAECGTHGYRNLKPTQEVKPPLLKKGESHTLRAEAEGSKMKVFIDNKLHWEGLLDPEAQALTGPSGVRSDNGRFKFQFFSSEPVRGRKNPPCHAAGGDD
ncbi:MAG TPA: hypothetical protein VKL40_05345 [Candidatus Angelobacter sp.]|nr:hypothetical protein [Candidatus Angelobacter sp.]